MIVVDGGVQQAIVAHLRDYTAKDGHVFAQALQLAGDRGDGHALARVVVAGANNLNNLLGHGIVTCRDRRAPAAELWRGGAADLADRALRLSRVRKGALGDAQGPHAPVGPPPYAALAARVLDCRGAFTYALGGDDAAGGASAAALAQEGDKESASKRNNRDKGGKQGKQDYFSSSLKLAL